MVFASQTLIIWFGVLAPSDPYCGDEKEKTSAFWERAFCTANRRGVVVLPNGKVTICEELYFHEYFIIGDITNQTLIEVWNSPRALELAYPDQALIPDGPCKDCPDFSHCHKDLGRCVKPPMKELGNAELYRANSCNHLPNGKNAFYYYMDLSQYPKKWLPMERLLE